VGDSAQGGSRVTGFFQQWTRDQSSNEGRGGEPRGPLASPFRGIGHWSRQKRLDSETTISSRPGNPIVVVAIINIFKYLHAPSFFVSRKF
jgi:hypothetical protein